MKNPIYDYENGELLFPVDREAAMDSKGRFWLRVDDNLVLNPDTNQLHSITSWPASDDSDSSGF